MFERAIEFVLDNEGGYVFDSHDSGGEKKYGICKKSYPELDIKNLTPEHAKSLYRKDWWCRYRYKEISCEELAIRLFDLSIDINPNMAIRLIQQAANDSEMIYSISIDGILGDKSIQKINECKSYDIYNNLIVLAEAYYKSLKKPNFLRGWMNRLHKEIP